LISMLTYVSNILHMSQGTGKSVKFAER
jgi:hypothetical protein